LLSAFRETRDEDTNFPYTCKSPARTAEITSDFATGVKIPALGQELPIHIHALFFAEIVDKPRNVLAQTEQELLQ
jgi:hypothetical protein